ncbi:Gfo/Idh/MocA family protein [Geminisphaera colitermitum]|uniref:Gfo/Idh/MocA family protein n=1 Tax=Geminisphaera colitermitum TaxID=1148786 RepID=UPI000158D5B1|nr:Gfo/Idh/MocA family oxidoreductase [Geminisphaera colitermitum]
MSAAISPLPPPVPADHPYAPAGVLPGKVVQGRDFVYAAAHLDHNHINGQCNGLNDAGAVLKYVYEPDAAKRNAFLEKYRTTGVQPVDRLETILDDPEIRLVASAAIPSARGPLGCRVLQSGKDYFTDKSPFTTLEQLAQARRTTQQTGKKYMVYYGERLNSEAALHAGELLAQGAIGQVVQVINLAPHRLNKANRPAWFFEKQSYGGILTDIGSHQFEQFLAYTGARDARINSAHVANFNNPDTPGLEDFGEASLTADNGASYYCRVDWLTPDGLRAWGDGRTFILGTEGFLEVRRLLDIARDTGGGLIFMADKRGEYMINCKGKVGFPFFGRLILDCLNRTENSMTQEHAFKAAELSMLAQQKADEARAATL